MTRWVSSRVGKLALPIAGGGMLMVATALLWVRWSPRPGSHLILRPGDHRICGNCIVPGTDTMLTLRRNGQGEATILARDVTVTQIDAAGGGRIVRREVAAHYEDSFVLERSTLAPIRNRRTQQGGTVHGNFEFSGRQVTGSVTSGGKDIPVQVSLPRASFLSNSIDLIAGAVAGERSFSAEVAFFSPVDQSTPEYQNLTVIGRRSVTLQSGETCSGVLVRHRTRKYTADFLIEERTRRLVHWQVVLPASPGRRWLEASKCPRQAALHGTRDRERCVGRHVRAAIPHGRACVHLPLAHAPRPFHRARLKARARSGWPSPPALFSHAPGIGAAKAACSSPSGFGGTSACPLVFHHATRRASTTGVVYSWSSTRLGLGGVA